MRFSTALVILVCAAGIGCSGAASREQTAVASKEEEVAKTVEIDVKSKLEKFVPIEIGVSDDKIPATLRPVVKKLVEAAEQIDRLYLVQVAKENPDWRAEIAENPGLSDTLAYFDIMYGPWDRLDGEKPFWGGKARPKGAAFYPEDLSAEEIDLWLEAHPEDKDAFTGYFTLIGRDKDRLKAVPYSEAYKQFLTPAASLLNEAADIADDAKLAKYLRSRAAAFATNEYRQSDMDWMDLGDGAIEVVIGPYEVYDDALMGYKAAFEAFVTLRDPEDSKNLAKIKSLIPKMEEHLPIPDQYKNPNRGTDSPISVVDVLFTSGNARAGVQTLAFNLPNDEVVREKKGSKKVLLKNVARAKYEKILIPIAKRLISPDQLKNVSFEAFFNHTLVHETAHGLGPGNIKVERGGKKVDTSVNRELKDLYSIVEEAKADVLGIYLSLFLIDKEVYDERFRDQIYASFLGGFFRSVRFGATEAHGKANLLQFNYLLEKGAVKMGDDGRYAYVAEKMPEAVERFASEILMIEALGDYDGAKSFIEKYGAMSEDLSSALSKLADIPTDIRPVFAVERQMLSW